MIIKKVFVFTITVVCMVCIAQASLAAPTQSLWDFLQDEGVDMADGSALAHVLTLGEAAGAQGVALDVALTVEGLYYDGKQFLLAWRTENLRPETPALVLYTDVMIDGVTVQAEADHPVSRWYPSMFGLFAAGDSINNLMTGFRTWLPDEEEAFPWKGNVEIYVHFVVKRPTKPMVVVDADIHQPYEDADTEADRLAMMQAMQEAGVTIAAPGDEDAKAWQEAGYLVVNRYGEHYLEDESEGRNALTGADLPDCDTQAVVISLKVDLDALTGASLPNCDALEAAISFKVDLDVLAAE